MAFPGTYNFSYYQGDTLEFRIYPKNADGSAFDLSGYANATFKLATARGNSAEALASQVECSATIYASQGYILCTIPPTVGSNLDASLQYVYDVQIRKSATPYDYIYTLMTGTVSVTDDVVQGTGA